MQNKYINTAFYITVIAIVIVCAIGNAYRFKADMYFDVSRKTVPGYTLRNEGHVLMKWAYNNAVRCNPLEFYNYSNILNRDYYHMLQGRLNYAKKHKK